MTKSKTRSTPAKGPGGRPTDYRKEYAELARKYCLLGATNEELGNFFEVATSTIDLWIKKHQEFSGAIKEGREVADATVAESLYKRANGYKHPDTHVSNFQGVITLTPLVKEYPPDTAAAFIWLKNRQRTKWRDRQELEHTGANGGPIETKDVSPRELARRVAFVLTSGTRAPKTK